MQLRNLSIPTGAVFAPMAGLTDAACRHLMADHGAAWTVSEMASAKALNFHDEKSLALLRDKHPHGLYAIQLFGAEPESMAKAILFVREQGIQFDILDINMGCPRPRSPAAARAAGCCWTRRSAGRWSPPRAKRWAMIRR